MIFFAFSNKQMTEYYTDISKHTTLALLYDINGIKKKYIINNLLSIFERQYDMEYFQIPWKVV